MSQEEATFKIKVHGMDIIEKELYRTSIEEQATFNFQVKSQSFADHIKKIIVTFVSVDIKKFGTPDTIGKITIAIGFLIDDFENTLTKSKKNEFVIPLELERFLKTISVSTMRGVMFSEFRGTHLHKAILPVIMTDSFVPMEGNIINK